MSDTPEVADRSGQLSAWRYGVWFVLLTLVGFGAFILSPWLQRRLGVLDNGKWFVDSFAILATNDAVRQGLDPWAHNPLDVYGRAHSYTHWWFALGKLGLTRADNFLVGGTMVALFLVAVFLLLAPRSRGELAWNLVLLLSPPVLLALNRANNDLLVFALLGFALWLVRRQTGTRLVWLVVAAALATGLKFFPVVAAGAPVILRPARRGVAWAAVGSILALLVFASVRDDLAKAVLPQPVGLYLFGSPVFWRSLGWFGRESVIASLVLLGLGAAILIRRRYTTGLAVADAPGTAGERLAFMTGALLLLACFAAGISYAYRWVFALWLAPWLWRQASSADLLATSRSVATLTCVLLTAAMWLDGFYCLVVNSFVGPMEESRMLRWIGRWDWFSQPPVWCLMLLLAGWIGDALIRTIREVFGSWVQRERKVAVISSDQSL
jgi:hypothetical protein